MDKRKNGMKKKIKKHLVEDIAESKKSIKKDEMTIKAIDKKGKK